MSISVWFLFFLLVLAVLAGVGIWEIANNYITSSSPTKPTLLLELEARLEQCRVDLEAMRWKNEVCKQEGREPEYTTSDWDDTMSLVTDISNVIERLQKEE